MRWMLFVLALGVSGCVSTGSDRMIAGAGQTNLPGGTGAIPDVTPEGVDPDRVALVLPDAEPARGGGLLGGLFRGGDGPVSPDVLMLPGQVGKNCKVSRRQRGRAVSQFPEDGRARWTIYDTAPGSTQPRTQYIDGFSDGCLRQVTAALMIFGAPDVHEVLRYDPSNAKRYSTTDTAYERIKGRVCGVRPRSPCPSDRIERLTRRTAFVTIYPRFGGTGDQVELLLDDGDLVAQVGLGG